jgi:hypothetical protein
MEPEFRCIQHYWIEDFVDSDHGGPGYRTVCLKCNAPRDTCARVKSAADTLRAELEYRRFPE